jgi:hypothetical protein
MPIDASRRMVPNRLVGVGSLLANLGASAAVPIPLGANAFYVGGSCYITFDGTAASATNGIRVSVDQPLTKPILLPQGATLNIFGDAAATYIQFCQVSC